MYLLQDGDSDIIASIYFVFMVSATAFFLLNAALAIVTETFEDAMHEHQEEEDGPKETPQNSLSRQLLEAAAQGVDHDDDGQQQDNPDALWGKDEVQAIKISPEDDDRPDVSHDEVRPVRPEDNC